MDVNVKSNYTIIVIHEDSVSGRLVDAKYLLFILELRNHTTKTLFFKKYTNTRIQNYIQKYLARGRGGLR